MVHLRREDAGTLYKLLSCCDELKLNIILEVNLFLDRWRVWLKQFPTLPSSLETPMTMLGSCQGNKFASHVIFATFLFADLSVLQFSLLEWTTMGPSFTTWTPVAHTSSLTQRQLAQAARELNRVCKRFEFLGTLFSTFPFIQLLGLPQEHDPEGGYQVGLHHPEAGSRCSP